MKRGKTERETCDLNGWGVGTTLRGHEKWANDVGMWTTIRITAIGDTSILARCIRHERTKAGEIVDDQQCRDGEHMWTLDARGWSEVAS